MVKYQLSIFGPNERLALEIPLTEEQVNTLTADLGTPDDPAYYDTLLKFLRFSLVRMRTANDSQI